MNAELAQLIALVTHGNLSLHGQDADLSANSTFQYVAAVKFVRYQNKQDPQGIEVAGTVADWFAYLRSVHVTRLWNIAFAWQRQDLPEHAAEAFAGGVQRAIQADLPDGFELWYPQWKTGGPKPKPWLVEYRSLMFPASHALPLQNLGSVKDRLRQAVTRARAFSNRHQEDAGNWAAWFTKSLDVLDAPDPTGPFAPDLLPASGYGLEARQLLAAAAQAFVFGGMGSWNDLGFEQAEAQREYEKVTQDLYEAIKFSLVMASNSFAL